MRTRERSYADMVVLYRAEPEPEPEPEPEREHDDDAMR